MTTKRQHGEPERQEGLGGRVRRFIDSELGRTPGKGNQGTAEADTEYRQEQDRSMDSDQRPENVHHNVGISEIDTSGAIDKSGDIGHRTTVEEPAPAPGPSRSREAAADGGAARVGLLNDPASLRNEWQQVQGTFVDDPQQAVHDASVLVERTLREIHANVTRGQLHDPTSTEDLRVSFQRYREFFQRLLTA